LTGEAPRRLTFAARFPDISAHMIQRTGLRAAFLVGVSAALPSLSIAAELRAGLLLVANKGDHTLSIVDAAACRQLAAVKESGDTGHEVAASPDGRRAFVPVYSTAGVGQAGTDGRLIDVIDLGRRAVVATIDLGKGLRPHKPVFGPKDGLLYVTTELSNSVTIIDPATLRVVGSVPTGCAQSHMLAISGDGRRGYTANVGSGSVSVLDLDTRSLVATIPVTTIVQRVSVSMDGRWVFTADQTKLRLVVIDTATNSVGVSIPLPGLGFGTTPTPDGKWLLVTLPALKMVGVVDLARMRVVRTIDVPKAPQEILVRPDGGAAYVSCDQSGQVAVISLADWKVERLIDVGPVDDGLAWAAAH
jgi:YVTN family beta-propeller protein